MAEERLSRAVLVSLIGAVITALVGLAFAYVYHYLGIKPDGEKVARPEKGNPEKTDPPTRTGGRSVQGPLETLSTILADLKEAKEAAPHRRYLTLAHLANAGASDDDLHALRTALADLAGFLAPDGKAVTWRPLDAERTVYALDLAALNWDRETTWRAILKGYPYGLSFSQAVDEQWREAEVQVRELSEAKLPYVRADWFLAAVVRPPRADALPKTTRPVPASVQARAQAYVEQRLTLDACAADLPRRETRRFEEFLRADPDRLRQLGLAALLQPGGTIARAAWESVERTTSPYQEVCRELQLGTPLPY